MQEKQLKNSNRKELFEAKARDKTKFDRAYIDTKGYYKAENRYKNSNTNDMNSMRYFVNKKLAEKVVFLNLSPLDFIPNCI